MTLEDMTLFFELVKHGSFVKTSEYTSIPKSTISRRISALEQKLGVKLLSRTTRSLSLTEAGDTYLLGCEKIINQTEKLERDTKKLVDEPSGTLSLFVPTVIAKLLWPVVTEFINDYPQLKLEIHNSEGRQELQPHRRYDLMLHVYEPKDSSMVMKHVTSLNYDYYATPAYIAKRGYLFTPQDVNNHQLIFNAATHEPNYQWKFDYKSERVCVNIHPHFTTQNPELSLDLCLLNKGVAMLPAFLATPEVAKGKLVKAYKPAQKLKLNIYALYHSRQFTPAKVSLLLERIIIHFKEQ
jgi:LysR family transcriptional regulator for bpeEF and oprC